MRTLLFGLMIAAAAPIDNQKNGMERPKADKVVTELDGYYILKGTNEKESYEGIVTIRKVANVYAMSWQIDVVNHYVGIGFRKGDVLVASCSHGNSRTALLYKIEPGPTLRGEWTALPGDGQLHIETLTFLKAMNGEDEN